MGSESWCMTPSDNNMMHATVWITCEGLRCTVNRPWQRVFLGPGAQSFSQRLTGATWSACDCIDAPDTRAMPIVQVEASVTEPFSEYRTKVYRYVIVGFTASR